MPPHGRMSGPSCKYSHLSDMATILIFSPGRRELLSNKIQARYPSADHTAAIPIALLRRIAAQRPTLS